MATDRPVVPLIAHELVAGAHQAHLATLLPDGSPHSVPLWVDWEGERLAFLTGPSSVKARNVARDPRVAVSLTDRERPWVMAQLRGRVVETVDGERGWEIIDRISGKYLGEPYPLREDRVVYLVEVTAASAAAFA